MAEPAFRHRPFAQRIGALGDEAEAAYVMQREHEGTPFIPTGLRRPPFSGRQLARLSPHERYRPDFLEFLGLKPRFVEAQGLGADQRFKMKEAKHAVLMSYDDDTPTFLYVWNNVSRSTLELDMTDLAEVAVEARVQGNVGVFDPDTSAPKDYYFVEWKRLREQAVVYTDVPFA
jgi:hypothetical protein